MWLTAWASSPIGSSHLFSPHGAPAIPPARYPSCIPESCFRKKISSNSSPCIMFSSPPAEAPPTRRGYHRWGTHCAAGAGVSTTATSSRAARSSTPLTTAILIAAFGEDGISRQPLRRISDSPASLKTEAILFRGGAQASRARTKLLGLLEALREVAGEGEAGISAPGAAAAAVKMVAACPELLLLAGKEVLAQVKHLRGMKGMTGETATQLATEFPAFFALPPAGRDMIGFLIGEVGLTAREVGQLAKRRPEVMENIGGGHVRRLVDFFLQDLGVDKATFLKIVCRQPGLLSLSVCGNVLEVTEYFQEELGLETDQIAKVFCSHPQVLCLSLEKNIRPVVEWLGDPDPVAQHAQTLERAPPAATGITATTKGGSDEGDDWAEAAQEGKRMPAERAAIGQYDAVAATSAAGVEAARARGKREVGSRPPPLVTPGYHNEGGKGRWDWGLGLGHEDRSKVVCKQGDLLWKSVSGNLAMTTVWFVKEVGLSWDEMRKMVTRSPALLSLSVEKNLEPTLAFLVKELGLDPGSVRKTIVNQPSLLTLSVTGNLRPKAAFFRDELGAKESDIADLLNQCPRVMNASVEGRILPRIQAMRAAGTPPSFRHLRPLCNYPEERFAAWFEKIVATTAAAVGSSSALALTPPRPPRGRRLGGVDGTPRPSVRATSLAELGISYIAGVRSQRVSSRRAPPPVTAAAAAAAAAGPVIPPVRSAAGGAIGRGGLGSEAARAAIVNTKQAVGQREAFFAPGRADAKALVRKLSPGLDVLDLCCGTGGFALNAAAGKARSALGVDKAARAVRTATKNAVANRLDGKASFVKADVVTFTREASTGNNTATTITTNSDGNDSSENNKRVWDLVIVDPPSFLTKSARSSARAVKAFARLAESVSLVVRPVGGMLVVVYDPVDGVFSTPEEMTTVFTSAAARAGLSLSLSLIHASSAGAREDRRKIAGAGGGVGTSSRSGISSSIMSGSSSGTVGQEEGFRGSVELRVSNRRRRGVSGRNAEDEAAGKARKDSLLFPGGRDIVLEGARRRGLTSLGSEGAELTSSPLPVWFALFVCSKAPQLLPLSPAEKGAN